MAYKVPFRNSFERDFKKLNSRIQTFVLDISDKIQDGILQGEKLEGNFHEFYKFPFGHKPEYRLVYKIYDCQIVKDGKPTCIFNDIEHTPEELMKSTEQIKDYLRTNSLKLQS